MDLVEASFLFVLELSVTDFHSSVVMKFEPVCAIQVLHKILWFSGVLW